MKPQFQSASKGLLFLVLTFLLQAFTVNIKPAGGDYFKVLLNNKMIAEQYLTQPVAIKSLSLTSSNSNDQLTFYYSHCGKPGSERSIVVKNADGSTLKQWHFSNGGDFNMNIRAKDLVNAVNKKAEVSVFYYSKEIMDGRLLIRLNLKGATA